MTRANFPTLRINIGATTAGVDMAQIYADIKRYADFFDRGRTTYENGLAIRNNEPIRNLYMGTAGGEMQPYTEYGATEATRTDQSWWNWGTPIRRYRDRQLYTEEYLVTANLQQLAIDVVAATNRYLTTRLKMMLRALLRNTNYTWTDNEFPGDADGKQIPVLALFNADANNGRVLESAYLRFRQYWRDPTLLTERRGGGFVRELFAWPRNLARSWLDRARGSYHFAQRCGYREGASAVHQNGNDPERSIRHYHSRACRAYRQPRSLPVRKRSAPFPTTATATAK
jgi:hypothetical protein